MRRRAEDRHLHAGIAARVIAATLAGYVIAYLFTGALPLWLPMARTETVLWSSLASYCVYTSVVLYAFGARSAGRMWLNLVVLMVILMAAIWWHR